MATRRTSDYSGDYQGREIPAQSDPRVTPQGGIYSGMTKRLAITDGVFCDATNIPKDSRKRGRSR